VLQSDPYVYDATAQLQSQAHPLGGAAEAMDPVIGSAVRLALDGSA